MPDRPVRRAQSVRVRLSDVERRFYDGITELCQRPSAGWGQMMSALMVYRYTASCIPASYEYLKDRLGNSVDELVGDVAVRDRGRPRLV